MAYKYCTECGHKVEYVGSLPKFCSSCGADMSSGAKSSGRVVKKSKASNKSELIGQDETDATHVPDIGRLQYTVEGFDQKTVTFGDLLKQADSDNRSAEDVSDVQRPAEET